ncbi:MAG: cytochrome c biogenesis protein CcsA [Gammaproteobacteria bacterium]|nr:cytochrome c biogenesis protein CcsA [Gammaproteobacteria bacterium]
MSPFLSSGIASLLYCIAAGRIAFGIFHPESVNPVLKRRYLVIGAIALLLHGLVLYQFIHTGSGLNLGFFNALSLVAWMIVLFVLVGAINNPLENLTIILYPVAAISLLLQVLVPSSRIMPSATPAGLEAHILLSICAYSLLGVAALQALVLAVQERQLRHKHPGTIMRALPPLAVMENLLFQLITIGFFLLSLSLATGFMFLHDPFAQHLLHKTVLSILAWLTFAILLWGRWAKGWRGLVAIRWTLAGFIFLMLAYFGSKLVLELVLDRV